MTPLLHGIQAGLLLCIMLGPIFFALIQTGVEEGMRAGLMVGLGIWISDALFIAVAYFSISILIDISSWYGFELVFGLIGGILLISFGVGTLFTKPPKMRVRTSKKKARTYFGLFTKGFLINTINPFTFFFWISVMSAIVVNDDYNDQYAVLFFTGIMLTIIITDIAKVGLAKSIRKYMEEKHVRILRKISSIALILLGVGLIIRVVMF